MTDWTKWTLQLGPGDMDGNRIQPLLRYHPRWHRNDLLKQLSNTAKMKERYPENRLSRQGIWGVICICLQIMKIYQMLIWGNKSETADTYRYMPLMRDSNSYIRWLASQLACSLMVPTYHHSMTVPSATETHPWLSKYKGAEIWHVNVN